MKKNYKENLIKNHQELFRSYNSLFIVKNCGLTVQNSKAIRSDLNRIGVKFTVVKNSLARIAVKDSKFDLMSDRFNGPIALVYAKEPVAAAKMLTKLIKDEMPFDIVAASVEGNILESKEVVLLAKLLTQNEIYGKIIALFKAVPTKLVTLLNEPGSQLVRIFKIHATNKQ